MTGGDGRPGKWVRSLRVKLVVFLTVALLPLGVIAVLQTVQVIEETERLAQRDALSRTARAAEEQAAVLQRAFGAANALGAAAANLADDPETCVRMMRDFIVNRPDFVFAGFIGTNGIMACNNIGTRVDYSDRPDWVAFQADPAPSVDMNRAGDVSGQSVYIVFMPIYDGDGAFRGGQAVSIPHAVAETLFTDTEDGLDLALVSGDGMILASSTGMDDLEAFERRAVVPDDLDIPRQGLLIAPDADTPFDRPTALVPLIPGQIYVLGLWRPGGSLDGVTTFDRTVPVFPLVMWIASLAIAYLTVNNLIFKPLGQLVRQMRKYHPDRPEAAFVHLPGAPSEVTDIAESYNTLLDRVAADTAALRDTIAEKETLLREVHHRVKNNLQLISSILNMQMRDVDDPGARHILSRVQDRVMSLSQVHRALYTDDQLQTVRGDLLIKEITTGMTSMATSAATNVDMRVDLSPVHLDPDQAVPLSLMATEAMTNALKYSGAGDGERAAITVTLHEDTGGEVVFTITNTRAPGSAPVNGDTRAAAGLGTRLISSFAAQLGGTLDTDVSGDAYALVLRFQKFEVAEDTPPAGRGAV